MPRGTSQSPRAARAPVRRTSALRSEVTPRELTRQGYRRPGARDALSAQRRNSALTEQRFEIGPTIRPSQPRTNCYTGSLGRKETRATPPAVLTSVRRLWRTRLRFRLRFVWRVARPHRLQHARLLPREQRHGRGLRQNLQVRLRLPQPPRLGGSCEHSLRGSRTTTRSTHAKA